MQIPIVNDNDEIIGFKERSEIWKELMRSVALRITNEHWETLLIQRASTKKREPNTRTTAVGGGVEQGETYEEAIIRETEEEIWIKITKPTLLIKRKSVNEEVVNFFMSIFHLQLPKDTPFQFDTEEIQYTKRLPKEKIDQRLATSPEDFVGAFRGYRPIISQKQI